MAISVSSGQKHKEAATGGAVEITLLYLDFIAVLKKKKIQSYQQLEIQTEKSRVSLSLNRYCEKKPGCCSCSGVRDETSSLFNFLWGSWNESRFRAFLFPSQSSLPFVMEEIIWGKKKQTWARKWVQSWVWAVPLEKAPGVPLRMGDRLGDTPWTEPWENLSNCTRHSRFWSSHRTPRQQVMWGGPKCKIYTNPALQLRKIGWTLFVHCWSALLYISWSSLHFGRAIV